MSYLNLFISSLLFTLLPFTGFVYSESTSLKDAVVATESSSKLEEKAEKKKTICLSMIVKDEAPVIERCLASVKPIIDYWVIVDTGSTDGTQEKIKEFMKDIPGELHEYPWINFGHNRNQALQFAKGKADYVLIIDADETLVYKEGFKLPDLDKDFYFITSEFGGSRYVRTQLVNNSLNWEWKGVLHEALWCDEAWKSETLANVANLIRTDGHRSTDPRKYHKDAEILEKAMLEDPTNTRNQFYLAQSYKDSEQNELAIEHYKKRIAMGGWDEEIFWSYLQIAILQEVLKMDPEVVIAGYERAFQERPKRAEALYRLALYYRNMGNYKKSYETALKGLQLRTTNDLLFIEQWVYDWGLLLEYSIAAYWTDRFEEAFLTTHLLLSNARIPENVKECLERNLYWVNFKLDERKEKEKMLLSSN